MTTNVEKGPLADQSGSHTWRQTEVEGDLGADQE